MRWQRNVHQVRGKNFGVVELIICTVVFGVVGTWVGDIWVEVRDISGETAYFRGRRSGAEVLGEGNDLGEFCGSYITRAQSVI